MSDNSDIKKISGLIIKSMSQQLTPDETFELNQWRKGSTAHEILFQRLLREETWRQEQVNFQRVQHADGWVHIQQRINHRKRQRSIRMYMRYAAAMVVLLLSVYYFQYRKIEKAVLPEVVKTVDILPGSPKAILHLANGQDIQLNDKTVNSVLQEQGIIEEKAALNYEQLVDIKVELHELQVPVGGEYQLILADGTRVWLNSASRLRYPTNFTGDRREVELTGEAYFEVAKNIAMPFIVKTTGMKVEVTGTEFNVKAYADEKYIATTLVKGSVMVSNDAQKIQLTPGEQALYQPENGQMEMQQVDVFLYTSWKDGIFEFKDMPLEEIGRQLSRWYDVNIEFASPEIGKTHFTGALKKEKSLKFILDAIGQTQAVGYSIQNKTVVLKKINGRFFWLLSLIVSEFLN